MGRWRRGERGRNGSGWASRVEVINQDLFSLFPSNRIMRQAGQTFTCKTSERRQKDTEALTDIKQLKK